MDKNKRSRKRFYINVGTDGAPKWAAVGRGFTKFREITKPRLYKRRYITDPADSVLVIGIKTVIEFELDMSISDSLYGAIFTLAGGGADFGMTIDVLCVDYGSFAKPDMGYAACRRRFTVESTEYADVEAICKGVLESSEDGICGSFYRSSGVFIAEGEVAR